MPQSMPVPIGRTLVHKVRRSQSDMDALTALINSDGFFLLMRVLRELGKPQTPECLGADAIQINALAHKFSEGWNQCLDYAENLVQILGNMPDPQAIPITPDEADFGAEEIRDRNSPFKRRVVREVDNG